MGYHFRIPDKDGGCQNNVNNIFAFELTYYKITMKIYTLIMLVSLNLSACLGDQQCPLVFLRDGCSPEEARSICWSPGQPDTDCPGNGICCFDGCSNRCGIPSTGGHVDVPMTLAPPATTATPATTTACSVVMVDVQESVDKEMCIDVPGPEACHTQTEQLCAEHCQDQEQPEEVCTTQQDEICTDKPCYPVTELVPVTETECVTTPEECHTVPEEECSDVVEEVCDDADPTQVSMVCEEVEVSGAECGSEVKCRKGKGVKCPKAVKTPKKWRRSVPDQKTGDPRALLKRSPGHSHHRKGDHWVITNKGPRQAHNHNHHAWFSIKAAELLAFKEKIASKAHSIKEKIFSKTHDHKAKDSSKSHDHKAKDSSKSHDHKAKESSKSHEHKAKVSAKAHALKGAIAIKAHAIKGKVEKIKQLKKAGCLPTKVNECREVPFPDTVKCSEEVCYDLEAGPSGRNVTAPSCTLVERTECVPERQTCADITKQVPVESTQHCPVPPQQICEQVETKVCKVIKRQRSVCGTVCKPVARQVCEPGSPVQECSLVPMAVSYKVPKQVCSQESNSSYY